MPERVDTTRSTREMPDTHKWVLAYLRREGRPVAAQVVGEAVTDRSNAFRWHIGYDRAYSALTSLERRGLVKRLPGRPARFEAIPERRFKGVPVGTDDGWGNEAYVDVTGRTQTAEDALAALIEADIHEMGGELDHDLIVREPLRRTHYKLGGDGEIACRADDPDRIGEWWIFDISGAC